jgi:nucleoside-diphosphate-sugar epimerase
MRIAVTGGNGRVGQGIIKMALAQGNEVVSIDQTPPPEITQPHFSFIQAHLSDYEEFVQAIRGCDALIHMAAIAAPGHHPDHIVHNNNVVTSYNSLRAAVEVGIKRVCQASSVNATGLAYSRSPHFDYFPLDEKHPTYNEDPYSLSKWICEEQGNSFARRYENMIIASMRFHGVVPQRHDMLQAINRGPTDTATKSLWAYTRLEAASRACLLSLIADFKGHEVFYIVAPETIADIPSLELKQKFYPDVPVRGDISGHRSFFDSSKAERLLGWKHNI